MAKRRLARALGSATLDLSTGGLGSLAMQVGRDALPPSQSKRLAHPEEEALVQAAEAVAKARGPERTCFLLLQALLDQLDAD